MDSTTLVALTICLIGSSAAGYIYGIAVSDCKAKRLEKQLDFLLKSPMNYDKARDFYQKDRVSNLSAGR